MNHDMTDGIQMKRKIERSRVTKETAITLTLNLDGTGESSIDTGVGFFDHMLTSFAKHGGFDLEVTCKGDLQVDAHHTIEDVGIVLGQAFEDCLKTKAGIARFGRSAVPMDEALAESILDISGRPFLVFQSEFPSEMVGAFPSEMTEEFFRAFVSNSMITLHIHVPYGKNAHHMIEAIFKSVARALREAVKKEGDVLLSTKGVL